MKLLRRILGNSPEESGPKIENSAKPGNPEVRRKQEVQSSREANEDTRQFAIGSMARTWLPGIGSRLASRQEGTGNNLESFLAKGNECLATIEANTANPYDREHMKMVAKMRGSLEAAQRMAYRSELGRIGTERPFDINLFFELRPEAERDVQALERAVSEVINYLSVLRPDLHELPISIRQARDLRRKLDAVDIKGVPQAVAFETHLASLDGQIAMAEEVTAELLRKADAPGEGMLRVA